MRKLMGSLLIGVVAASASAGLIFDNFGDGSYSAFERSEANAGSGDMWILEDFYVSAATYPDGIALEEVRWVAQVDESVTYTAQVAVFEYDSEGGTFTEVSVLDIATVAFGSDAGENAVSFTDGPQAGTLLGSAKIADAGIVLDGGSHYFIGARLVGSGVGSHKIASIGDSADNEEDHNKSVAAADLFMGDGSPYNVPLQKVTEAPFNATDDNEFAYQIHGTIVPEPASVLLVVLGAALLARRR